MSGVILQGGASFNPYCNGCASRSILETPERFEEISFNPYCNGCASRRVVLPLIGGHSLVSILIVMDVLLEDGLVVVPGRLPSFQSLL